MTPTPTPTPSPSPSPSPSPMSPSKYVKFFTHRPMSEINPPAKRPCIDVKGQKMAVIDEDVKRLLRAYKTILRMLKDRGFGVTDDELAITEAQFIAMYGENMKREDIVIHKVHPNNCSRKINVFFPEEANVGVKDLEAYTSLMQSEGVHQAILVVQQDLTHCAREFVSDVSLPFHFETFQEAELLANIEGLDPFPVHEALSAEGAKKVLGNCSANGTPLPCVRVTDPLARYFGLKRGEVVETTYRTSLVVVSHHSIVV